MSEKLKPCPFCGGEAEYSKTDTSKTVPFGTMQHFVTCKKNCIEGLYARGNTKEEAIEEWNKRPNPWHTGTPTEKGWYLVAYQHKDKITYRAVRFFIEKGLDMEFLDSEGGIYYPDIWKAIAYQKIEPYRG